MPNRQTAGRASLMLAVALAATGCARHRPPVLPPEAGPAPVDQSTSRDTTVTDTVTPGSAADFKRSVQSDTVHFALDQYDIDADARGILDAQAQWLARYPQVRVTIEGHCDERGTREYNLALGDRRANSAKNYLAERGVNPSRISVISYGKERPVAPGSDEGAYAQNRRAVTVVIER